MNPFGVLLLWLARPPSEQWATEDALHGHRRPLLETVCWILFASIPLFAACLDLLYSFAR